MKRPSVQRAALVEPVTVVAALVCVLSSTVASQQGVWKNVTPPDMPDFGRVSLIDASAFDAYVNSVARGSEPRGAAVRGDESRGVRVVG